MCRYVIILTVTSYLLDVLVASDKAVTHRSTTRETKRFISTAEQIERQILSRLKTLNQEEPPRKRPGRIRKGVSSSSVVNFKRTDRTPRRKNAYPSNWGTFSLYCRTGWLLQVLPNGVVNGTRDINSQYALLQIQVLTPTLVRFKGVASSRYIGINSKGRLMSKRYPTKETLFQEEVLENSYRTFNSSFHPKLGSSSWYMGIRKNGNPKKASRTKVGEKCIQFLKLSVNSRHIR